MSGEVRKVRFEPIGEEIECGPQETVLDAAFRQGYNLVYGCREGQCSACKCFLLEGDVALQRYSNFALSDTERTNGYALMCRAMPEENLVVELLHYDPDNYRLEHLIADGEATVETVEALTHDITRLVLRAPGFDFTPGQYVDLHVPGADDGAKRSFSMANIPSHAHATRSSSSSSAIRAGGSPDCSRDQSRRATRSATPVRMAACARGIPSGQS